MNLFIEGQKWRFVNSILWISLVAWTDEHVMNPIYIQTIYKIAMKF